MGAVVLPDAWTELDPHPVQSALWRCTKKFAAVVAGRGSGKTEISRRRVVRYLPIKKPWPDPIYFYALPTYAQAKRVAWEPLKALIPPEWIKPGGVSESELTIETVFGSKLFLLGLDKPERAEGVQWDGGVIDESSDQKPGVFQRTFVPTFSHRDSWCWRIGVPKRYGVGGQEFRKFYEKGFAGDPDIASFWWKSADIITAEALETARATLSDVDFAEQYEAGWQRAGGRVFHAFDKSTNVAPCYYYPDRPIFVGSDFNVDPMAWTLSHEVPGPFGPELHQFDEVWIRDTNTAATLDHLWHKYGQHHRSSWTFIGDASSKARHTNAAATDYKIILNDERFKPKRVLYPKTNPPVADRFASCNALFCNAKGTRRYKIDPRCSHTIDDLENRTYKEGTREPDDAGDVSHASDALGYVIHVKFPILLDSTSGTVAVAA